VRKKLNIAVCGLGFGGAFVPIYKDHPHVGTLGVFDTDRRRMEDTAEHFNIKKTYASFEDVLGDGEADAVHLVTPIPLHGAQSARVLDSGKHCACTVPMATTLEDIEKIIDAKNRSGKNFMLMETTLYTRQFFYAKSLLDQGVFGKIQLLRGSHYQDMENWPDYWMGLPPMWYGTHAVGPLVALSGSRAETVNGFGSGTMRGELVNKYDNPFPVEIAVISFANGLKAEATRSLFETARCYQEGMHVYGSKASLEWGFYDNDNPILTKLVPSDNRRGYSTPAEEAVPPAYYASLPEPIRRYTVSSGSYDETNPQNSLDTGAAGGHHGSHPHLVHEFLSSIWEDRKSYIDEQLGGHITAVGICAHQSAMERGKPVKVPFYNI
jgi:predicted dehydrogenase